VKLDGLQEIVGASGGKTAASGGSGGEFQHRIEDPLVEADQDSNQDAENS
jgi:hypothetical protein